MSCYLNNSEMKSDKKTKGREDSTRKKQNKCSLSPRFEFNISYDSLKCFINPLKLTRLPKKKQNLQPILQPQQKQKQNINQNDLTRELSNSILQRIETQGIMCKWEEQLPIEAPIQQNEQDRRIWRTFSQSYSNKSFASTEDIIYNNSYTNTYTGTSNIMGHQYILKEEETKFQYSQSFQIQLNNVGYDARTTIMIRNIPNKYTIQDLSLEIDSIVPNTYDFLYLPCDLKNQCNVGYGFINFINTSSLIEFYNYFHSRKWRKFRSEKICMLAYARLQGLQNLIEHFENSKVLNQKDKRYHPIIMRDKIQNLIKQQQQEVFRP